MILIKDRHSKKLIRQIYCFAGNMILIKDRHPNKVSSFSTATPLGKYDTYKGSTLKGANRYLMRMPQC